MLVESSETVTGKRKQRKAYQKVKIGICKQYVSLKIYKFILLDMVKNP